MCGVTTWETMSLDYSPDAFGEYIANFPRQDMQEQIDNWTEKDIYENFSGFVLGVDSAMLMKPGVLDSPIDMDAFERGEIALIATDNPDLFKNVHELTISPYLSKVKTTMHTILKSDYLLAVSFPLVLKALAPVLRLPFLYQML